MREKTPSVPLFRGKTYIRHQPSALSLSAIFPLNRGTEGVFLLPIFPLNRGTEGVFKLKQVWLCLRFSLFFFLKVLISVRIGPADVRQLVEVYFRPAA